MLFAARFGSEVPNIGEIEAERPPTRTEPVIGLALGGGAARGWAHIGILKVLDRAGIRPGIVVGTSIGAVVGGCWAGGKLAELEEFALSLTRRRVFGLMDITLQGSGLIGGSRLKSRIEESFGDVLIEDLPVRFAAVATELRNGHEVWLTRGRLGDAMRASYALPGVFVPVKLGGRWLTDGALVNPVPISTARALGADLVIGVNLHSDVFGRSSVIHDHGTGDGDRPGEPTRERRFLDPMRNAASRVRRPFGAGAADAPGIATVMMDAFNITQDRIARSRLAGDPPDVMLSPKLGKMGLAEFHRAAEAIACGELAAERALGEIAEVAATLAEVG